MTVQNHGGIAYFLRLILRGVPQPMFGLGRGFSLLPQMVHHAGSGRGVRGQKTAQSLVHCLRDAPLWTVYAATGVRRSEALGMKWSLIHWDEGAIELGWVVVEEDNTCRLRKLTKDADDNAVICVDQSVINVLKWQKQRQDAERDRLGSAWVDHDLVFARDGFKLYRGEAGGPQDPEKVSARWRTLRNRLHLPEDFRNHDWRHSKVTNDLEAGENPVEVSANVRHHSPGYTMARYGHSRKDGARRPAAAGAGRLGLSSLV